MGGAVRSAGGRDAGRESPSGPVPPAPPVGEAALAGLNGPQRAAASHHLGPIVVLAGAGSGKTRVLTRRIAHLVLDLGEAPDSILAVTFTNKATAEMRARVASLLGRRGDEVWVATFHSAGLRILRRHAPELGFTHGFTVYDDQDSKALMKRIVKEAGLDEKRHPPTSFLSYIDRAKNFGLSPADARAKAGDVYERQAADMYRHYQEALKSSDAMDFGDLLYHAVVLLRDSASVRTLYQAVLRFVLVDEFQDTNPVQYDFVRLLTGRHRNLLVVGDDDQSIYAFRGATVRNILDFRRDFPDAAVVTLEQNYRSTRPILEAAFGVIRRNEARMPKKLWTERTRGKPIGTYVAVDEQDEADYVARSVKAAAEAGRPFSDFAVFYRTNAQSRALEEAFMTGRVPYRIYGGLKFYDRKEIKDVLAYLRLTANPADVQAFERAVTTPPRGIGAQTVARVTREAASEGEPVLEAARRLAGASGPSAKPLALFVALIDSLRQLASVGTVDAVVDAVLDRTDYEKRLVATGDASVESRLENLRELRALARSASGPSLDPSEALRAFLDRVALSSSADEKEGPSGAGSVSLMTLHVAKGLEFPVVYFTGLEEGLLPHYRAREEPDGVDEERRLCYVGITRAMDELYLSRSCRRGMFSAGGGFGGSGPFRDASPFLADLPDETLEEGESDEFKYGIRYSRDDAPPGGRQGPFSGSRPAAAWRERRPVPALRGAEELSAAPPETDGRVLLSPDELGEGARVTHPTFGTGTITAVEGSPALPATLRVTVRFDGREEEKRLSYSFARLSAG